MARTRTHTGVHATPGADDLAEGHVVNVSGGEIGYVAPGVGRVWGPLFDLIGFTPALEVAQALANRVGAHNVGESQGDGEVVAAVESPTLVERLELMMKHSDNVYAEAIGREVALARGTTDAPGATLSVLEERGFNTAGVVLRDNSGLSTEDRIAPKLLDAILADAATKPELRPIFSTLPVAAGDGTLEDRYGDLPGRGWVRAKTGTLDGTASLAGTVTSVNGNIYTFALICNDADVLDARRAMDEFTSALRQF